MIRYYVPTSAYAPAHIRKICPLRCEPGVGPDAGPDNTWGGGMVFGGAAYVPGEAGWQRTAQGWWFHVGQWARPQAALRLDLPPDVVHWHVVPAAVEGGTFYVPQLLRRAGDGFTSALDPVRTATGWRDNKALADLADRVVTAAIGIGVAGEAALEDAWDLVVQLIGLGHHLSAAEVAAAGWVRLSTGLRILCAASGIEVGGMAYPAEIHGGNHHLTAEGLPPAEAR